MDTKPKIAVMVIAVIVIAGIFCIWLVWRQTEHYLIRESLEKARIVVNAINIERLPTLKGDESDLQNPNYRRIKKQLIAIRETDPRCAFLYLMGQKKSGEIFFFIDAQRTDSKDYAPPGLVYHEVSKEYITVFQSGKEELVGPVKDRWGTLVTSLIPIFHPETKKLLAVLGMDIKAGDWYWDLFKHCLIPTSLTVVLILVTLMVFILNRDRETIKKQLAEKGELSEKLQASLEQVQQLKGIIPICAYCKKIRDDRGYWNQLEMYIRDHSEADFSHGICPECYEKLEKEER